MAIHWSMSYALHITELTKIFHNQQFLPQILSAQQPDGSFKAGRPNWPSGDASDPIYRQCLCTLQLEVYYRYLKVADRAEESIFER